MILKTVIIIIIIIIIISKLQNYRFYLKFILVYFASGMLIFIISSFK